MLPSRQGRCTSLVAAYGESRRSGGHVLTVRFEQARRDAKAPSQLFRNPACPQSARPPAGLIHADFRHRQLPEIRPTTIRSYRADR
jgi:hypothetical protein